MMIGSLVNTVLDIKLYYSRGSWTASSDWLCPPQELKRFSQWRSLLLKSLSSFVALRHFSLYPPPFPDQSASLIPIIDLGHESVRHCHVGLSVCYRPLNWEAVWAWQNGWPWRISHAASYWLISFFNCFKGVGSGEEIINIRTSANWLSWSALEIDFAETAAGKTSALAFSLKIVV